mmetsp:Transcript_111935/g.215532  ORF Transcript_111935/g.215532 Transcript_111935/m.215532 type:complete len:396 (-) Transcript_111935:234-1421(-)
MSIPTGSRVTTDLPDLSQYGAPLKTVFRDLQTKPDPSFLESMAPISNQIIPEAQEMAHLTYEQAIDGKRFGKFRHDPISEDHVAVIIKYCQEDTIPPLYQEVNCACYKPDRQSVNPFKLFLWLLVRAMASLQPYPGSLVHRGVKRGFRSEYPVGREFTWQGFTSTTKCLQTLMNDMFLGDSGERTMFTIELTQRQARDISAYSPLDEGEVLLPPASRFRVMSTLQQTDLTIVHLLELPSEEWILKLPQSIHPEMLEQWQRLEEEGTEAQKQLAACEEFDKQLELTKQDLSEALRKLQEKRTLVREHLARREALEQQLRQVKLELCETRRTLEEERFFAQLQRLQLEGQSMKLKEEKMNLQVSPRLPSWLWRCMICCIRAVQTSDQHVEVDSIMLH